MKLKKYKKPKLTYKKSGVDYSKIDPLKVLAQKTAKKTAGNLLPLGYREVEESRGESAYVVDVGNFYIASITECLGTKALVADEVRKITGKTYYDAIAQDTIAMAVNDIITVGAQPVSVHAYWASGDSNWFEDEKRTKDLVKGWEKACKLSGVSWGGGETPVLKGVVKSKVIDLAASCVGVIKPKKRLLLGNKLKAGDAIVVFESSGIHANGLSLARKIVKRLAKGYATKMDNGKTYGEGLLAPTLIYVQIIKSLLDKKIKINYISNITGHGWRKIMRHPKNFIYRITKIPPVPEVLKFMMEKGPISQKEAYGSLNMGAGLAIFVSEKDVKQVISVSKKLKIKAYVVGKVEKGSKKVVIEPLNIVYKGKELKLRS